MVDLIKGLIQQGLDEEGQFIVVWWLWYNSKPCKVVVFILLMPNKSLFIGFCLSHIGEYFFMNYAKNISRFPNIVFWSAKSSYLYGM
jgi:hypothetical protein